MKYTAIYITQDGLQGCSDPIMNFMFLDADSAHEAKRVANETCRQRYLDYCNSEIEDDDDKVTDSDIEFIQVYSVVEGHVVEV